MSLEDKLTKFINETSGTLGRIEASQTYMQKSIDDFKPKVEKIPLIEVGLNNHLTAHNTLKRYFLWIPASVVVGGVVLGVLKYLFGLI